MYQKSAKNRKITNSTKNKQITHQQSVKKKREKPIRQEKDNQT
jgi:hypothetical protein